MLDASGTGTLAADALGDGSSTDNCSATETSPLTTFTCADAIGTPMVRHGYGPQRQYEHDHVCG